MTVADLAAVLAVSLFDGGWLTTPDPTDEMVSLCIEEIIDLANFFFEGDVLERNGQQVGRRPNSADRAFAEWAERNFPRAS